MRSITTDACRCSRRFFEQEDRGLKLLCSQIGHPAYVRSTPPKSSIPNENMCAGVCWSDQECAGMRTRIFRPDAIPTHRYMIRRNPFSFASLDFISVVDDGVWKPMKSNHSVRVQSESIG